MVLLATCLMVLSVTSVVAENTFTCSACTYGSSPKAVNPGDLLRWNGTIAPYSADLPNGYSVERIYAWNLWQLTPQDSEHPCTPASCTEGTQETLELAPGNSSSSPVIWMYAPTQAGIYMLVLTATYDLKHDSVSVKQCIKYACALMCVTEPGCPTCSAIFCEQDCGDYLKVTSDCSCFGTVVSGKLCYPINPEPAGINVVWYVVDADAMQPSTKTAAEIQTYLGTATIVETIDNPCMDPDWCDNLTPAPVYGNNTYQIYMTVEDDDQNSETTDPIVDWCPIGTVVQVADPAASITELTP